VPKTFFTADHHFKHTNIIRYCNRRYKDINDMGEALICYWNAKVGKYDTVYYLGDFVFGGHKDAQAYLERLNGVIYFIRGNHDKWIKPVTDGYRTKNNCLVEFLPGQIVELAFSAEGGRPETKLVLCHYPLREWPGYYQGAWHLHGHTHGTLMPQPGTLDVGVDCFEGPVELDELSKLIEPQVTEGKRPAPLSAERTL